MAVIAAVAFGSQKLPNNVTVLKCNECGEQVDVMVSEIVMGSHSFPRTNMDRVNFRAQTRAAPHETIQYEAAATKGGPAKPRNRPADQCRRRTHRHLVRRPIQIRRISNRRKPSKRTLRPVSASASTTVNRSATSRPPLLPPRSASGHSAHSANSPSA